jgi:hypothetical protein
MATDAHDTARSASRDQQAILTRRKFLARLSIAAGGLGAALIGIPVVGFLLAPLLRQAPQFWRPVGAIDTFKVGETVQVTFQDPSPLPWAGVSANTVAATRGRATVRSLRRQLHPLGLPGALAARRAAVYVPVPRRGVLPGRRCSGRATATPAEALRGAREQWPGGDSGRPKPDRH